MTPYVLLSPSAHLPLHARLLCEVHACFSLLALSEPRRDIYNHIYVTRKLQGTITHKLLHNVTFLHAIETMARVRCLVYAALANHHHDNI